LDAPDGVVQTVVLPKFDFSAQVINADGTPDAGDWVYFPNCNTVETAVFKGGFCPFPQQLDATGRFHLSLPPGSMQVLVMGPAGILTTIAVTGDVDTTINLAPLKQLSGQVVDADGNGAQGNQICLV